jgi:DNA transformation protein
MSAPDTAFVEHCMELLRPLGTPRSMRMFGGRGFYVDEVFVAIAIGEQFYLKTDGSTREAFIAAGSEPFSYERDGKTMETGYLSVPAEAMESPALMQPWARLAMEAALRAKAAGSKTTRKTAAEKKPPVKSAATKTAKKAAARRRG